MLAALGPYIMRHPDLPNVEEFMLTWVTPALATTEEPFIRAVVRISFSSLLSLIEEMVVSGM